MADRCGARAARQHELLERRQLGIELVEIVLEPAHVLGCDLSIPGQRQLRAYFEKLVLNPRDGLVYRARNVGLRQQQAERAVRLVYIPKGGDSVVGFADPLAIGEPRRAVVAGARVYLAEPVAHALPKSKVPSAYGVTGIKGSANRFPERSQGR